MTLVGDRMQVVNIFKEPRRLESSEENTAGRRLQKQQTKRRERENAKKQSAKTQREKASETEKKNKNKWWCDLNV